MTKILIVRRDNIGDLVCTLPLIASIRALLPEARIDLLVNSYCEGVVVNNPDVDNVYVYTKAKHKGNAETLLSTYGRRLLLTLKLRSLKYDWLVLANVGYLSRPLRWARQVAAKRVVGFIDSTHHGKIKVLTHPIRLDRGKVLHEVDYLMQLLEPFGTVAVTPVARIVPDKSAREWALKMLRPAGFSGRLIGVNISARLPSQRWPAERFIELIFRLKSEGARCVLFWAPGSKNCAGHPGDDDKAIEIINSCVDADLIPFPTDTLGTLIAGISTMDLVVTADGGALHIAAACNKPVVAMFGESNPLQWYPWGVPHVILHPESRDVCSVSVEEVVDGIRQLLVVRGWCD